MAKQLWAQSKQAQQCNQERDRRHFAAVRIQHTFRTQMSMKCWRLMVHFLALLARCKNRLALAVRCWRRGRAADQITQFFGDYMARDSGYQMRTTLMRFHRRVRLCQRAIRDFLMCRKTKLKILKNIFDDQQAAYINVQRAKAQKAQQTPDPPDPSRKLPLLSRQRQHGLLGAKAFGAQRVDNDVNTAPHLSGL